MDFHNFLCTTSQENAKVIGEKVSCHTFVMLLPYRVKVSDTKVTHFTPILALLHVYIDHIYRNQYRWNKQNTAESHRLKIYVHNINVIDIKWAKLQQKNQWHLFSGHGVHNESSGQRTEPWRTPHKQVWEEEKQSLRISSWIRFGTLSDENALDDCTV